MSHFFENYVNPGVLRLEPYIPGMPIEEVARKTGLTDVIKLASNENPLGACPSALSVVRNFEKHLAIYPDGSGFSLRQKLANHLQVSPEQIILGNGSDNVEQLVAQVFIQPEKQVLIPAFTFATLVILIHANHGTPILTPLRNWKVDLNALTNKINDKTCAIFLANPNNPTGTWITEQELITLLERVPPHVIVVL